MPAISPQLEVTLSGHRLYGVRAFRGERFFLSLFCLSCHYGWSKGRQQFARIRLFSQLNLSSLWWTGIVETTGTLCH